MLRILLVDDSPLFRKGLSSLLASQPGMEVVGEASDGFEALEKARVLMPDLILMDIKMPRCDGLEATHLIKEEMPYVKIVVLTVSEDEQHLFEAVKAGAQGYLLKNLEPEDLFELLQGISLGEAPISGSMAAKILKEFARQAKPPASGVGPPTSRLTEREKEVLELVAKGATNREIAEALFIAESTVKNHLRNIMEKLHVHNRLQAALYALGEKRTPPPSS